MIPYIGFLVLSIIGIIRIIIIFDIMQVVGFVILLYWLVRNIYFLIMSLFLIDGRDFDGEAVNVIAAEFIDVEIAHGDDKGKKFSGVTTLLTEHYIDAFFDNEESIPVGKGVKISIDTGHYHVDLIGTVTGVRTSNTGDRFNHSIQILDFCGNELEYLEILYDRIPTLPQSLSKDFGIMTHLWQNIAYRVARTRKR